MNLQVRLSSWLVTLPFLWETVGIDSWLPSSASSFIRLSKLYISLPFVHTTFSSLNHTFRTVVCGTGGTAGFGKSLFGDQDGNVPNYIFRILYFIQTEISSLEGRRSRNFWRCNGSWISVRNLLQYFNLHIIQEKNLFEKWD